MIRSRLRRRAIAAARRLASVIAAARAAAPRVLIQYHSCGEVRAFVDGLIAVGVDILNPVQPACMPLGEVLGRWDGLLVRPTHVVEPQVPWEDLEAYISA